MNLIKTLKSYTLYILLVAVLGSCNDNTKLYTYKQIKMFAQNDTIVFCWAGTTVKGKVIKNNVAKKTITMYRQNVTELDYWMKEEIEYDDIKYCY